MNNKIVTRFAPSPTGTLHAGSYRTAIYSYLYAKKNGGKFVLRIEDTDKERSTKEYEENILESLEWLGIKYDEKFIQSERVERHKELLKKMIEEGSAYVSKESPSSDFGEPMEGRRAEVIRFKNPNKKVSFVDEIRGVIEFDTTELKDFVIAKSLDEPLFHLAVVADDFDMGITHVIRGEDHISNTPRQILIAEAIGATIPHYAHLPLVLGNDRAKLSKRKGALALTEYKKMGYLSSALLNYITLVGWNPGGEQEIFTEEELIELFDLKKVQKGGAIFDEIKLKWVNKEHMKKLDGATLKQEIVSRLTGKLTESATFNERIEKILPIIIERISYFGEVEVMEKEGEFDYYFAQPSYDPALLFPNPKMLKGEEMKKEELLEILNELKGREDYTKDALWPYAEEKGRGRVLWPLRALLSGREKSPDPFTLGDILGKDEVHKRLECAIMLVNEKISN